MSRAQPKRESHFIREPLLAGALRVLLPTPTDTLFLRACLRGDVKSWRLWRARIGDPKQVLGGDTRGIKRLSPLLYAALRDAGEPLEDDFLSYLRAATVREELRARTYRRVARSALETLAASGLPFIVLKGASLVESAYGAWALRHCHDLDLLVHTPDLPRAVAILREFSIFSSDQTNTTLVHPTNLPIALHTRLFENYPTPPNLWEEAVEASITNTRAHVLAPHHALQHLCVHAASHSSRQSLLWTADAVRLMATSSINWKSLAAASHQNALPLFVTLRYLRDALDADIPADILQSLAARADSSRALALQGALATARRVEVFQSARGWKEKAFVAAWLAGRLRARR